MFSQFELISIKQFPSISKTELGDIDTLDRWAYSTRPETRVIVARSEAETFETAEGVEYTPHSMMHKAIVCMDETILEMLDGFERTDSGHKFVPDDSNVRVILTGRDWSEKRALIYGSTSTEEAQTYVEGIIDHVREIGHEAELVDGPEITNIAVSGDLGMTLRLEELMSAFTNAGIDAEYEPEQFPAAIVKIDSPPVTFLLFSTGKFIIQGLRGFEDIEPAIERTVSLL